MPSNKPRLYIGLYARNVPNSYHWAFLVSPKKEAGTQNETTRYHVVNRPAMRDGAVKDMWTYEQRDLVSMKTQMLLVRVLIAKIAKPRAAFDECLARVPVVQDDPDWRCRAWVSNALARLVDDKILGGQTQDWTFIERESVAYVERKKTEGRFQKEPAPTEVPTYDLIVAKEVVR
ncbi:MAG: hypothetical protein M1819_006963 [Sarea resinae]|nr:MAG: hypothetical protein M1819_006963 [Sarea resinae]